MPGPAVPQSITIIDQIHTSGSLTIPRFVVPNHPVHTRFNMASCRRCQYRSSCSCYLRLRCLRSSVYSNTVADLDYLQRELANTEKAVKISKEILKHHRLRFRLVCYRLFGERCLNDDSDDDRNDDWHHNWDDDDDWDDDFDQYWDQLSEADANNLHALAKRIHEAERHFDTYAHHRVAIMGTLPQRQLQALTLGNVELARTNNTDHGEINDFCHIAFEADVRTSAIKRAREFVERELESVHYSQQEFRDPQELFDDGSDDDDGSETDVEH